MAVNKQQRIAALNSICSKLSENEAPIKELQCIGMRPTLLLPTVDSGSLLRGPGNIHHVPVV